jgi:enoyl-CoA hydratase
MNTDIEIRKNGAVGHITLNRPDALNALTYEMCLQIDAALIGWATDDAVLMVVIDAAGPRAFCAGGDIARMYATGMAGDYDYGRRFWADEYRMNARIAAYPKPVVSFLHGFTMGGGVGAGCHGAHRIVCETSKIAMPECGIGLVPDVGGSLLLTRAPGRLGAYLGTTGARMGPADAIHAGFADVFIPQADWPALKETLFKTADTRAIIPSNPGASELAAQQPIIDRLFASDTMAGIMDALANDCSEFAAATQATLAKPSPLAMACLLEMIRRLKQTPTMRAALELEYRFTYRAMEHSAFLEGIRAAIIDKDRSPKWRYNSPVDVSAQDIEQMLAPLGAATLTF